MTTITYHEYTEAQLINDPSLFADLLERCIDHDTWSNARRYTVAQLRDMTKRYNFKGKCKSDYARKLAETRFVRTVNPLHAAARKYACFIEITAHRVFNHLASVEKVRTSISNMPVWEMIDSSLLHRQAKDELCFCLFYEAMQRVDLPNTLANVEAKEYVERFDAEIARCVSALTTGNNTWSRSWSGPVIKEAFCDAYKSTLEQLEHAKGYFKLCCEEHTSAINLSVGYTTLEDQVARDATRQGIRPR